MCERSLTIWIEQVERFDSFGRLHTVTNPTTRSSPTVTIPAQPRSHRRRLNGQPYTYLQRLDYDKFEQRIYMKSARRRNQYTYDPDNRRLETLQSGSPGKGLMQT